MTDNKFDSKEMEEWLGEFFLDPLTTYLDETVFRIDLFDSEKVFIVEALLPNINKDDIDIIVSGKTLQIKAKFYDEINNVSHMKSRTVYFPIDIEKLQMCASFQNDLLEIEIAKN